MPGIKYVALPLNFESLPHKTAVRCLTQHMDTKKKTVKKSLNNNCIFFVWDILDDNNDDESQNVLEELENIDDDCDRLGIQFVKIDNLDEAKEYGIETMPALLYFEKGIPTVYEGRLEDEESLLKWLEEQTNSDAIEDVTDEMLAIILEKMPYVAVLFCKPVCLKHEIPPCSKVVRFKTKTKRRETKFYTLIPPFLSVFFPIFTAVLLLLLLFTVFFYPLSSLCHCVLVCVPPPPPPSNLYPLSIRVLWKHIL